MFCPKCGTNVPEGSKFCETCGNNMQLAAEHANIQEQQETPQEAATIEPQPAYQPQPQPQPVYQAQPQTQPQPQPQPQSPIYPLRPATQPQPQPQPQYQPRPQPAPQNSTYNGMDPREKPYSVGGWLLTRLIMIVPIVNIVMPFVWAFGSKTNKSKKNFFIAALIWAAIWIVLGIIFAASIVGVINNLLQQMSGLEDIGSMIP